MVSTIAEFPRFVLGASLLVAPGMLLLLALPGDFLSSRTMLPGAFILSPGVVAAELAAAAVSGVPFAVFAPSAGIINLAALAILFLYRRPPISFDIPIAWLVIASLIFALLAGLVIETPLRREYGWHNMLQLAAIQDIYSLPHPPEDIELAGIRLNYAWLGWAQVAAIAKLTGTAPTLLFFPLNMLHFLCLFIFLCEAASSLFVARPATVGFSTVVALLSAGLIEIIISLFVTSYQIHGEIRIEPMLSKYTNMDQIVFGISAIGLLTYTMIRAAQSRDIYAARLMALSALAACLTYPLFLPSCISIGAAFLGFAVLASWRPGWYFARYSRAELGGAAVIWVVCLASAAAYVAFLSQDATTVTVALRPWELIPGQIIKLAFVFCLIDGLLMFIAYRAWRARSGVLLLMTVVSCGLQFAFVLFAMTGGVEYKFLFAALIVTVPVISAGLTEWVGSDVAPRFAMGVFCTAVIAACLVAISQWHEARLKPNLTLAEPLDEASPEIRPFQGWSTSWLRAVREGTPSEAVLLTGASKRPIAVFAARALYVCADLPQIEPDRPGYSMPCLSELQLKSYAAEEISRRLSVLDRALAGHITQADTVMLMEALSLLARPVALHTEGPSGFLTWLEMHHIGRSIFATDTETVWLIDRNDFPSARDGTHGAP
jgi:hypothetical protein